MEGPRPKTRSELQAQRKSQLRKLSNDYMENFYSSHPYLHESSTPASRPVPPVAIPYIPSPQAKTKTELESYRKSEILSNQSKTKQNSRSSSNPIQTSHSTFNRADPKDLSLSIDFTNSKETIKALRSPEALNCSSRNKKRSQKVKEEAVKHFMDNFEMKEIGVHGEELPKFSQHLQDYWKMKEGYCEKPSFISRSKKETRPISEFCRLRVKRSDNNEVTAKPGQCNPFSSFLPKELESAGMRLTSRSRFTEEILMASRLNSTISIEIGSNLMRKKLRPHTANVKSMKMKKTVRSSGFL